MRHSHLWAGHLGSHVLDLVEGSLQHGVNIGQHVLLCCSNFLISDLLNLCVNKKTNHRKWSLAICSQYSDKIILACALLRAAATAPTTFPAEAASQTTMAPSRPASLYI